MLSSGCHFDPSDLAELFLQDKTFAWVVDSREGPYDDQVRVISNGEVRRLLLGHRSFFFFLLKWRERESKASRDALGVPLLCLYVIDRSSPGLIILLAFFASLFNVVGSVGSCSCCRLRVASALLSCNYLRKRRLGDDGRGRLFEPADAVACRYEEQLVTLHASLPSSNLSNVSASLKSRLTSRHAARGRCQSRRFWSRELNGGMQSGAVVVVVVGTLQRRISATTPPIVACARIVLSEDQNGHLFTDGGILHVEWDGWQGPTPNW
ncbi:hypothetical protein GW17_00033174 [Ensete ventricosum]|nr:hypothetical protein GW17_00033174 [Ensete ventricosum]